eukprot:TRINITY_DN3604_c0_g2_i1.p1 TRINITY_DN3604_c0_g2~~TRINITY_DN3604_c0_g2_i1.p1  ORF type:complete len:208 (-),score=14.84 TRINITY_DN3604_c0_g2_i1:210-833(-)
MTIMINFEFIDVGKVVAAITLLIGICGVVVTQYSIQKEDQLKEKFVPKWFAQSNVLILLTISSHIIFAIIFNWNKNGPLRNKNWETIDYFLIIMGYFGVFLRMWSMRTLGPLFTFQIGIRKDHTLIKTGPYKFVRHPSYVGLFLAQYALVIFDGLRNPKLLIIFVPLSAIKFCLRIWSEEKMMKEEFGKEWTQYCLETPYLLVPGLF